MKKIDINIIIVCYNDGDNLETTLNSIRKNRNNYHRLFIIDGCSIDNTNNIIRINNDIINDYLCEKDSGIYNAMNKVLKFESIKDNDFLYWLNAGDELQKWDDEILNSLQNVDCCFAGVYSKKNILSLDSKTIYPRILQPYNERTFFPNSIYMHQGFLIRKSVFKKYLYDENIGLQAENLLMSKCILNQNFVCTNYILATYYTNGISNTKHFDVYKSFYKVLNKLNMSCALHVIYHPIFHIKYIIKILLSFVK